MMKKVTTNLRVPVETLKRMAEFARVNHSSMNAHIVKAIELYLEQNGQGNMEEAVKSLTAQVKQMQKEMEKMSKKLNGNA